VNLALNRPTTASSTNASFVPANAVDANPQSYWEGVNGAFSQWLQVDLGSAASVNRVTLRLPSGWETRTQTLSIQGSVNGSSFTTLSASAGRVFNPASGNAITLDFPATSARYVRVNVTANTGWPAAQLSQFEVYGGTTGPGPDTQAPSAPSNLTVSAKTSSSVSLSWGASTDNVGVTGYQVRRAGAVVATVAGLSATVGGLSPATVYSFTVTATDAAGNTSNPSNTVSVTTDPAPAGNLAAGKSTSASGHTQNYVPGNVVDGNSSSYWESPNNAFPQWVQVDLGASYTVSRVVLKLPPATAWQTRTQTLSIQGSVSGSSFITLSASAGRVFNPATGNTVTVTFGSTSVRYVRVDVTGNTGWPAGQLSELEVYSS
jgi:chitodextrinase